MDQPWVYIVLFGLVFIVYAKIMPKSSVEKGQQGPSIHEIEETMDHFAAELEEQNRLLLQQLAEMKKEYELQTTKLSTRVDRLEAEQGPMRQELVKLSITCEELQKKLLRQIDHTAAAYLHSDLQVAAAANDVIDEEEQLVDDHSMNMKLRYAELFALYDQGKSTDSIAKKLHMTKGEVNLIIQLAKQEEKQHAQ